MSIRQIARRISSATSRRANRALIGSFKSVARIRSVLAGLVARVNGDRATAAAYLTNVLGADADFVRRYGSVYGKTVTRLMREQGVEPSRNGLAIVVRHGHPALVRVNTYPRGVLAAAASACPRTAALIGA